MWQLYHGAPVVLFCDIESHSKVRSMVTRFHMQAIEQGNKTTTLFPTNSRHWHPIMEDVAFSEAFDGKLSEMTSCLERTDEWHYISMDATMKICLKVMGQESYRASKQKRDAAPFPDEVALRRILTVRGRSGAVLLLHPLQGEASEQVVAGLVDNFTEAQLKQVRHVAYDSPSEKLYGEMLGICPNMQSLMLDPVHIAIVYEYGFWNKRSAGSKQLRRILQKFNCFGQNMTAGQLGSYYNGSMSRPLQMQENKYREMILDFSMEDHEVDATLTGLQPNVPFADRAEFIKCIAALCAKYKHEVSRKAAGPNKEIYKILWSACSPDRLEWLMNHSRTRQSMHASYSAFLPSGTSSNEALHAELNSWSRSTHAMHRSTLVLRLKYYRFVKMMQHYMSTQYPLTHVVTAELMLGRSMYKSIWTEEQWKAWCSQQNAENARRKAALPLCNAREAESALVAEWVRKRPATQQQENSKRSKHTTPLTVRHRHSVKSAGVRQK